jgi:hypothetical protein
VSGDGGSPANAGLRDYGADRGGGANGGRMQRSRRRLAIVVAVLSAAAVLWLVILVLPGRIVRSSAGDVGVGKLALDQRLKAENDVRTTLLQGLWISALLTGAFLTWRQLGVTREGQITDRYTKAIDQLGSDKVDVRIGGVYALDRVAKDSIPDRSTITAVLCTFVRERATVDDGDEDAQLAAGDGDEDAQPAADVQAALTVLGQIGAPGRRVDLSGAKLRNAALKDSDFEGAEFTGADLRQAWLLNARLRDARFRWADLRGAVLRGADLRGTKWGGEARESGAHLEEAEFHGADLRGADLRGAHLAGARADATTRWPGGLSREAVLEAGVVLED